MGFECRKVNVTLLLLSNNKKIGESSKQFVARYDDMVNADKTESWWEHRGEISASLSE